MNFIDIQYGWHNTLWKNILSTKYNCQRKHYVIIYYMLQVSYLVMELNDSWLEQIKYHLHNEVQVFFVVTKLVLILNQSI